MAENNKYSSRSKLSIASKVNVRYPHLPRKASIRCRRVGRWLTLNTIRAGGVFSVLA